MALLLILFGVLMVGALADFLYENDLTSAATQPVTVAGTTVHLSTPAIAAIAFGMGVLAVLCIAAGIRRTRRTRRKTLKDRIARLEEENDRLVTQKNLPNVIRIPDSEPVAWSSDATPPPPAPTQQPAQPEASEGSPSPRW
jgi:hypothetical protein